MEITMTELKNDLKLYIERSSTEDIVITKNGKIIAKIVNPYKDRIASLESIFGILPEDTPVEKLLDEKRMGL